MAGSVHYTQTSAELERQRVRVTKAIRRAIDEVGATSPGLGAHLLTSIETGRSCHYQPAVDANADPAWSAIRCDD